MASVQEVSLSERGQEAVSQESDGASVTASERVVWLTATVFCGIWILSLVPALPAVGSGLRSPPLGLALLVAITFAWIASLLLRWIPAAGFVAILAASTVVQAANTDVIALTGPYAVLVPWVNLATVMAALLLAPARAVYWIVGIPAAALASVAVSTALIAADDLAVAWRGWLLMAAYPVAVGFAALVTKRTLIEVALTDDEATQQRLISVEREQREQAGVAERFQISRLLHDTVVNTFGAVREGSSSAQLIRQRSEFDLQALESHSPIRAVGGVNDSSPTPLGPAATIVQAAQTRAKTLGLTLTVRVKGLECDPPDEVITEVAAAVGEALVNVSKHSGVARAELVITSGHDGFQARISDRGHGFSDGSLRAPESIRLRCAAVGVGVSAEQRAGGGALIVLTWARGDVDRPNEIKPSEVLFDALIPATRRFSICLVSLFALNTALVIGVEPVGGSVSALLLITGVIVWALATAARGIPIPWFVSLILAISAALVAYLPTLGVSGCNAIGISWWGALGSSLCIVVIVLLSGQLVWIIAGCLGYLAGLTLITLGIGPAAASCVADSMPGIILTDVAFVGAVIAFRRMLQKYGKRAEQSKAATEAATARAAAIREHERIRRDILESVVDEIRPLLGGLADGMLDPTDPAVRQRCANDELYLRALVKVDPNLGALGDAMTRSVQLAHACGGSLSVQCAEKVHEPTSDQLDAIESVLDSTVAALPPGAEALVTLFPTPAGASMTVVAPTPSLGLTSALRPDRVEHFTATETVEDDQVLVELTWQ